MENLNDVEFGSDKGSEEAPILVAQRYLNIFRQVHIFNKQKREQFDDELLALPQNIFELFKKMPGGRLLVEHIEEVKTERGISFVKSNREDFLNGSEGYSDKTSSGVVPVAGGNVVMDSSFAETFAQSMASALKQIPNNVSPVSASNINLPAELSNVFELIAEEIHSSRNSLLEVLKETKNITDTVVASQVSISRILDSILSARQRDDADISALNDRIIASQASIAKILEKLCNNPCSSDSEVRIENKLSRVKSEIVDDLKSLLSGFKETPQKKSIDIDVAQQDNSSFQDTGLPHIDVLDNLDESLGSPDIEETSDNSTDTSTPEETEFQNVHPSKKKKKKKQKKGGNQETLVATTIIPSDVVADDVSTPIDGVIRNSAYKHEDDFSNVNLNEPPLDIDSIAESTNTTPAPVESSDLSLQDFISDFDPNKEPVNNDEIDIDDVIADNEPIYAGENTEESDELIGAFTKEMDTHEDGFSDHNQAKTAAPVETNLDNFVSDDDFDFELPQKSEFSDDYNDTVDLDSASVDSPNDIESDDGLEFALPKNTADFSDTTSSLDISNSDISDLNDFIKDDSTSVADEEDEMQDFVEEASTNIDKEEVHSEQTHSYSSELDKIKEALTSQEIDLSSLEEPIELDDYSDDENVHDEDDNMYKKENTYSQFDNTVSKPIDENNSDNLSETGNAPQATSEEDWEWEYVDENGNVVSAPQGSNDDDWEWEYVEEDESSNHENNQ